MRFLIIGLGSIGTRHAKNLCALGHDIGVYDPRYLRTKNIEFPKYVSAWLTSLGSDNDFDACIIATPTIQHAPYISYAHDMGWHTLIEKPIADRLTIDLESNVRNGGNLLRLGNNLRFHPSVRLARRYIKDGLIGKPIWASIVVAQFNDRPQYLRDGVILNWGAHEIDLALWLLGPAAVIAASADIKDTVADICLLHANDCRSVIHLDYLTKPEMRQTVIVGDQGRMVVSLTGRYVALQRGDRGEPPEYQQGSFDLDYRDEMIAFVNAIQGRPWPGATAEDGLATLKIINAAQEKAREAWRD